MYTLIWRSACFSPTAVSPLRSSPVSISFRNFVVFRVMSLNTVCCVFVPIASATSSCLPSMTFLDSLLIHVSALCHWLTSSLNWTLIRAVLELYHPFTDAFLYMPSSHLSIMTLPVANSSCCHLSQYRTSLICYYWCWFSYTPLVASFVVYPPCHRWLAGNFLVAASTSDLRANSEPVINGYLWLILPTIAILNSAGPLQLLYPSTWFCHLTLCLTNVCYLWTVVLLRQTVSLYMS